MSTKISVEVDEKTLRRLVLDHLNQMFNGTIGPEDVKIKVRSKQNFRDKEWEDGEFKATIEKLDVET